MFKFTFNPSSCKQSTNSQLLTKVRIYRSVYECAYYIYMKDFYKYICYGKITESIFTHRVKIVLYSIKKLYIASSVPRNVQQASKFGAQANLLRWRLSTEAINIASVATTQPQHHSHTHHKASTHTHAHTQTRTHTHIHTYI